MNNTLFKLQQHIITSFFLLLSFLFLGLQASEVDDHEKRQLTIESVYRLDVSGSINPATYSYFQGAFKKAEAQNVDLILITMNTPGGLVSTTKDILNLFGESDIPVAMWVRPEGASATSAGAILASGTHLLFMSEGTNMGAATPIQMGGDIEESDSRNKAVNDLVALVKSLADARGRNAEGFELMISEAKSFTAQEALEENLINGIVNRENELWEKIDGQSIIIQGESLEISLEGTPQVETIGMDPGQLLLNLLASPMTAYVLFLIGAALLYFEFQSPGGFIAGGVGVFCVLLAGIGFQVLPLNFGALALIALAFVLFLLEVYVTTYGIFTIAGVMSLITGSLFLYRTDDSYIEVSLPVIFSSVGAILAFVLIVIFVISRDQKNVGKKTFNEIVNKRGKVIELTDQASPESFYYQVKVGGEFWKATSKQKIEPGEACLVTSHNDKDMILEIIAFNK